MNEIDRKILEVNGWSITCESPFEIEHEDGSLATGQAAYSVLNELKFDDNRVKCKVITSFNQNDFEERLEEFLVDDFEIVESSFSTTAVNGMIHFSALILYV